MYFTTSQSKLTWLCCLDSHW